MLRKIPKHALYYPTARRLAEFGQQGQIYAICKKGCEKGRVVTLTDSTWPDGSLTWVAIDYHDMHKFAIAAKKLFTQRFESAASDKAKRIYDVLRLKEIGW